MNKIKMNRKILDYITKHVGQNYVGLYLILHLQDQKGTTLDHLSQQLNLSPRTIIRNINKLENKNLVEKVRTKFGTAYSFPLEGDPNFDDIEYCEIQEDIINNIKDKDLLGTYSRLLILKNYFTHETISNYNKLGKESQMAGETIRQHVLKLKKEELIKTIKGHARGVTYFIFPKEENNH